MEHKILLVDANALVHRAFHALPPLSAKDGQQVNAVYGFFSILLGAISSVKPEYIAVAFDEKGPTFRDELFKAYKAKRVKAPQSLYDQIPLVKSLLQKMEIPIIAVKGFEADDIIGTLNRRVKSQKLKVKSVIVTGDKDTFQLIDENTSVLTPRRGLSDPTLIGEKEFRDKYGFEPENMIDYKALAGDASDNIPGVAGVGDVTAKKLIIEFKTVENIYNNLEKIEPRYATKLEKFKHDADLSKKLATIVRDMDFHFNLKNAKLDEFDEETAHREFEKLGFKSLINRLPKSSRKTQNHIQPTLL